ncbi:MAG: anthranilate synthase component I family protein [Chlamydiales bacterium]|nr:anthranilate synthase component I family protein [Chlamydiales bacterium]
MKKDRWIELPCENSDILFQLAKAYKNIKGCSLLCSGGTPSSQSSFFSLFPYEYFYLTPTVFRSHNQHYSYDPKIDNPWDLAQKVVGGLSERVLDSIPLWMGYFSYEMGAYSHRYKYLPFHPPDIPLAYFFKPALVFKQTADKKLYFCFREESLTKLKETEALLLKRFINNPCLELLFDYPKVFSSQETYLGSAKLISKFRKHSYKEKFLKVKKALLRGEVYQVNLSESFVYECSVPPFHAFSFLRKINPSPFSAFFNFGSFNLVSSSPERFLLKEGSKLETRPIKGTIKRGATKEQDKKNKLELFHSNKDRAELLMITDLLRNDLSKVSKAGSVVVDKLRKLEVYQNVFHTLSIISSQVKPEIHPVDIVREMFPGGSITGCPKISSMEMIYDLEGSSRGIYTGSMGYFSSNGDFDFNIAIRSILFSEGKAIARFGGAIVYDSELDKEVDELMAKGSSIFSAMKEPLACLS